MAMGTDSPRARKGDPISSHVAADRSAETRGQVHEAVVEMLSELGPMNGQQLNDTYRELRIFRGWPMVAFDSPRKRAGELVGGRVTITNREATEHRGTPAIYGLPEATR